MLLYETFQLLLQIALVCHVIDRKARAQANAFPIDASAHQRSLLSLKKVKWKVINKSEETSQMKRQKKSQKRQVRRKKSIEKSGETSQSVKIRRKSIGKSEETSQSVKIIWKSEETSQSVKIRWKSKCFPAPWGLGGAPQSSVKPIIFIYGCPSTLYTIHIVNTYERISLSLKIRSNHNLVCGGF